MLAGSSFLSLVRGANDLKATLLLLSPTRCALHKQAALHAFKRRKEEENACSEKEPKEPLPPSKAASVQHKSSGGQRRVGIQALSLTLVVVEEESEVEKSGSKVRNSPMTLRKIARICRWFLSASKSCT